MTGCLKKATSGWLQLNSFWMTGISLHECESYSKVHPWRRAAAKHSNDYSGAREIWTWIVSPTKPIFCFCSQKNTQMYSNYIISLLAYECEGAFLSLAHVQFAAKLLFPLNYANCFRHFFHSGKRHSDWMPSCPSAQSLLCSVATYILVCWMPGAQFTGLVVYIGCGRPASYRSWSPAVMKCYTEYFPSKSKQNQHQ